MIWTFENVQKEIIPYPKHGKYDAEPEGMEDEAVESVVAEHENAWEEDGDEASEEAVAEAIDSDTEPDTFDASDWVNPAEAREKYANTEEDLRCRGDKAAHTTSTLSLHCAQHTALWHYQAKMDAYKECFDNLKSLRSPIPQGLCNTVERVMEAERKRLHTLEGKRCPAHVFARMDEMLQADTKRRRILR